MKSLACLDIVGSRACSFLATGETEEEVVDEMQQHVEAMHPSFAITSGKQLMALMQSKMEEV